jgi:hypothetical protein
MWTPAVAAIWESWRLTRWRLLLVPALAAFCGWLWSRRAGNFLDFLVLFTAAVAMALSLPSFGARPGFPLSKAFARPIRTSVLVAAPLSYVFAAAAASYLLPAAFLRIATGAALPLVPAATFIGALAVLVAGGSWVTRDATSRTGLAIATYVVAGVILRFLDPFRYAGEPFAARGASASPELFVLSGKGYLTLVLVIAVLYLWILFSVGRQRHGEDAPSGSDPRTAQSAWESGDILESIRSTCREVLRWRCPTSSPTAAEIWFELQYYGIPVLVIGALLALCIPALISWGNAVHSAIPVVLAACTLAAPLLAGVGASIWNRRDSSRAKVPAFEAARPIGTATLIGLQLLVSSACIGAAWIVMSASFWLSLPLLTDLHLSGSPAARASEVMQQYGVRLVGAVIVGFTLLATLLAFLAALRAFASSYGFRVWLAAGCLVLYFIAVAVAFVQGRIGGVVIDAHLWSLVLVIPVGTLLALGKALAAGSLKPRQAAASVFAWLLFAALCLDLLRTNGVMHAPAAITALALASTLLPLMAVGIAPWSLSLIRHA